MPSIRPITDLRNNSNEIVEFCKATQEPVFITKNGIGEVAVLSMDQYEQMQAKIDLYSKLAEVEADIANGDNGVDFLEFTKDLRGKLNGAV